MSRKYFFFGRIHKQEEEQRERRITRSENFIVEGGSKEEHEELSEKAIKIDEKLKKSSLRPEEVNEIFQEALGGDEE